MLDYTHPRITLVTTLKRLYDYGMTTTSGGNLSIKDDEGNIWITPSGIDKGTLRPEDVMMVKPDGEIIGPHRPSVELPFHRSVYALRPDVRAVLHAHSPALVAFSLIGRMPDSELAPFCGEFCGKVAFAKYEIPGSEKLGKIISAEFKKGADSVIMENHGAVMCGTSIAQAFARFEALDHMARIAINASGFADVHASGAKFAVKQWPEFTAKSILPDECAKRDELVRFQKRSYDQALIYSGSSFLSTRLGKDDFLVTPANFDSMHLESREIVRMNKGKTEAGKTPSLMTEFCREVYKNCDWANAVFMARPTNAMVFADSLTQLDSRTIPESYIELRDMPLVKAADFVKNPAKAAKLLTPSTPVLLIESFGMVTTGKHLLEAFDRMEVGEFTAKCILMAKRIGKFMPINQKQVDAIIKEFNLPE